ncbi:MAG: hypothetical protein KIT11_02360 [Fimbriimonadaceae bacterium]|nr:hypothetical protein [Fimbriimonadaceae bacterium]QYK54788.1 MAG: hypothetical protein KF733_07175 [Fimbriimonadaceae bacterium]
MTLATLLLSAPLAAVQIDYAEFEGLQVRVSGVPVVRGSSFQYFEAGSGKGLYNSRWQPKEVARLPDASIRVRYQSKDGLAHGTLTFKPGFDFLEVRNEFKWRGEGRVRVENTPGFLWGSAVASGSIRIGEFTVTPRPEPYRGSEEGRMLGPASERFEFDSPLAKIGLHLPGTRAQLADGRGMDGGWASGDSLFRLTQAPLVLKPGDAIESVARWSFDARPLHVPNANTLRPVASPLATAISAPTAPSPEVPKPKERLDTGEWVAVPAGFEFIGALGADDPIAENLARDLGRRWMLPAASGTVRIDTEILPTGLGPDGYVLTVSEGRVRLVAEDRAGLRFGLQKLVDLAQPRQGVLVWPATKIRDWPSVAWRGVHLFAGPRAVQFQPSLVERLVGPMRFNHVVLQCDRSAWPGVKATSDSTSLKDLATLAALYRHEGLEPVPLIQSLGHMGWFFAGGENLELAMSRDNPFTIDPRKEPALNKIREIWKACVEVFAPKTIHFGLDEFDRRGMPDDPALSSRLWQRHVPWLGALARSFGAEPMFWGDMMLAPSEASAGAHASDRATAAERRRTLPAGSWVCDWHYEETTNFPSLKLFKSDGLKPIAASWWKPANIRGHTLAAVASGSGTLQTTWAGTVTDEGAVYREPKQFAAYVLAGDYAWSGRTDAPDKLPYDPMERLRSLLFGAPSPVDDRPGQAWSVGGSTRPAKVGPTTFLLGTPLGLYTPLTVTGQSGASEIVLNLSADANEVGLALDCVAWMGQGVAVADLALEGERGATLTKTLYYGAHVRAPEDVRPLVAADRSAGACSIRLPLPKGFGKVTQVRLTARDRLAGVRILGVTTW